MSISEAVTKRRRRRSARSSKRRWSPCATSRARAWPCSKRARPDRDGGAPLGPPGRNGRRPAARDDHGEAEEIARLRKQLREVTEERDILARAVGFFAKGTR